MSLSTIAQIVFFGAVGLLFLLELDSRVLTIVAGVAALVCAVLLLVGENRRIS